MDESLKNFFLNSAQAFYNTARSVLSSTTSTNESTTNDSTPVNQDNHTQRRSGNEQRNSTLSLFRHNPYGAHKNKEEDAKTSQPKHENRPSYNRPSIHRSPIPSASTSSSKSSTDSFSIVRSQNPSQKSMSKTTNDTTKPATTSIAHVLKETNEKRDLNSNKDNSIPANSILSSIGRSNKASHKTVQPAIASGTNKSALNKTTKKDVIPFGTGHSISGQKTSVTPSKETTTNIGTTSTQTPSSAKTAPIKRETSIVTLGHLDRNGQFNAPMDYSNVIERTIDIYENQTRQENLLQIPVSRRDYSQVDNHASYVPLNETVYLDQLSLYLTRPFRTVEEKTRAIFTWIAKNIRYDWVDHNDAMITFKERRGICGGYAALFSAMCFYVEIYSVFKISGHARGRLNDSLESHAWNAIQTEDGLWHLIDCTWAAGYMQETFKWCFKDEYFFIPPEELIYSHFPQDPNWQGLPSPISKEEFMENAHKTLEGYVQGVVLVSHKKSKYLLQDTHVANIIIQAPAGKDWQINLFEEGKKEHLQGHDLVEMKDDITARLLVSFPKTNVNYEVNVFRDRKWIVSYLFKVAPSVTIPSCCTFVKIYKGMQDVGGTIINPKYGQLNATQEHLFIIKTVSPHIDLLFNFKDQYIPMVKRRNYHVLKTKIPPGVSEVSIACKQNKYISYCCRYYLQN